MSVSPGHRGALDVYVPLVDWGARFEAIRAPIRLRVDLQTVDRQRRDEPRRGRVAGHRARPRRGARRARRTTCAADRADASLAALALGLLVAFAIRCAGPAAALDGAARGRSPRSGSASRWSCCIPPRGEIANPQYYAHGPDIPRALEAVEAARRTSGVLDQELDAQLVGLARLVSTRAGGRASPASPLITVASDLHNNAVGARRARAARRRRPGVLRRRPDRPRLAARDAARAPRGAHRQPVRVRLRQPRLRLPRRASSPARARSCSRATGRLQGRTARCGPIINTISGPARRGLRRPVRARARPSPSRDRYDDAPDPVEQDEFLSWLQPLIGKVDVVMVHEPALISTALAGPRGRPARAPARVPRRPHAQGRRWTSSPA